MFKDCLLESGGVLKTQSRWWAVPALLLNTSLLILLMVIPLIYPEALPRQALETLLIAPPPPPSAPPSSSAPVKAAKMPSVLISNQLIAPTIIPKTVQATNDDGPPASTWSSVPSSMSSGSGIPDLIGAGMGNATQMSPPFIVPPPPKKVAIPSRLAEGNLLNKTAPIYPAIARQARIQGTVVLAATISKSGTIEKLHILSGPQMLQQAAINAVSGWLYKPYMLNDQPVEVETQINVIFRLGE
jgi:periplasmic protein TonB